MINAIDELERAAGIGVPVVKVKQQKIGAASERVHITVIAPLTLLEGGVQGVVFHEP